MLGPVDFQRQYLGRKLWSIQKSICTAVSGRLPQSKRSISIKGCHGSGKTYVVSGLVAYEMLTRPEVVVLTVAPTLRQVKLLWSEIETAIQALPIRVPERTTTGWELSEKCKAIGFSSSKGVNAQGFHGKNVLVIVDEAIGIAPDMWDAIEGIRASGDVRIVKLCNPTVPNGAPFDDFTRLRAQTECITISAFDTPNLAGLTLEQLIALPEDQLDVVPVSYLTRRRWVKEMYFKWGPTNPRFLSRVLGEFPTQADDAVFNLAWIEKAALPYEETEFMTALNKNQHRAFIQVGLDIAGPGDDETSVCARIGPYILGSMAWSKADPLDEVLRWLSQWLTRFAIPMVIMADVVGIGYHFARAIARQGFDVREFRAGTVPTDTVMFANAKAEAYWRTRECMKSGDIHGIDDEDTKAQLSGVRYRELPNGKIEIEHKDEARARGASSPDRAEALILAFARIVPKEQTVVLNADYQISPY